MKTTSPSTNEIPTEGLFAKPERKRVVKVAYDRWRDIPWHKLERKVWKLQKRIYQASRRQAQLSKEIEEVQSRLYTAINRAGKTGAKVKSEGNKTYRELVPVYEQRLAEKGAELTEVSKKLRKLQRLLMKSRAAKLLSIRKVTQENSGKKTAGVDGKASLTPRERLEMAQDLRVDGKAQPARRVWIPKPGKNEKRPLGIPVMKDRAKQMLVLLALEPEWEAVFEPNSYGFRKGRSCHDAIRAIWDSIRQQPKWVLDADIAKCFDRINHKALLNKLGQTPKIRRKIWSWLKSGVIDDKVFQETEEGTPQGGVISPLLANIALHGLENRITQAFPLKQIYENGKRVRNINPAYLIRYADDFVVLHEDLEVIQQAQKVVAEWLNDMGLELKPEKTHITHTLDGGDKYGTGFDFLGWTVRQHKAGKHQEYNASKKKVKRADRLGFHFHTVITPSDKKVKAHLEKLHRLVLVGKAKAKPQAALIKELNLVLRGWASYNRTVNSKETFAKLDHLLWEKLYRWMKRRHPRKTKKWLKSRYFAGIGEGKHPTRSWEFADKKKGVTLLQYADTKVISPMQPDAYVKVEGDRSPYDGNVAYWATRLGKHPEIPQWRAKMLKEQKGRCAHCGLYFLPDGGEIHLHHIDGNHRNNKRENKELVHEVCHQHIHGKGPDDDGIQESRDDDENLS